MGNKNERFNVGETVRIIGGHDLLDGQEGVVVKAVEHVSVVEIDGRKLSYGNSALERVGAS